MIILWSLLIISGSFTLYYGAVIGGVYKAPLLARFRCYGTERRILPICRFLNSAGLCCVALAMLLPRLSELHNYYRRLFPTFVFVVLVALAWGSSLMIYFNPRWGERLPQWYFELLRTSSRQERRQMGYAWLRLPFMMRVRLNGDQKAFRVWAELVRLTVIYGAHDPYSPWSIWT